MKKFFKVFSVILALFIVFIAYQIIDYKIQEQKKINKVYEHPEDKYLAKKVEKSLINAIKKVDSDNNKEVNIELSDLVYPYNPDKICAVGSYARKETLNSIKKEMGVDWKYFDYWFNDIVDINYDNSILIIQGEDVIPVKITGYYASSYTFSCYRLSKEKAIVKIYYDKRIGAVIKLSEI